MRENKFWQEHDDGKDLKPGDIVWVQGEVLTCPSVVGDVKVMFFPRPGFDEFAAPSINAIFLRRSNLLSKLFGRFFGK